MITHETMAATVAEREREIARLAVARQAQSVARTPTRRGQEGWTWAVEPGMGEAFRSLRGWLLSPAGGGAVEYLPGGAESS